MVIVSHCQRMIFLKTRKTAGSSIEIWLAPLLDPATDLAACTADLQHYHPAISAQLKPRGLKPHATAAQVRCLVGEAVWQSYFKFSVERSPWDRVISLWRWRCAHRQLHVSIDEFLAAVADGSPQRLKAAGAEDWSNWPIYTIEDRIVADDVILYEDLEAGLERALARVGITYDGRLPRAKANIRAPGDTVDRLSPEQRRMIARLFEREIRQFRFVPSAAQTPESEPEEEEAPETVEEPEDLENWLNEVEDRVG